MNPEKITNPYFPDGLSQPAHRALKNAGLKKLDDLNRVTEKELAKIISEYHQGVFKGVLKEFEKYRDVWEQLMKLCPHGDDSALPRIHKSKIIL